VVKLSPWWIWVRGEFCGEFGSVVSFVVNLGLWWVLWWIWIRGEFLLGAKTFLEKFCNFVHLSEFVSVCLFVKHFHITHLTPNAYSPALFLTLSFSLYETSMKSKQKMFFRISGKIPDFPGSHTNFHPSTADARSIDTKHSRIKVRYHGVSMLVFVRIKQHPKNLTLEGSPAQGKGRGYQVMHIDWKVFERSI